MPITESELREGKLYFRCIKKECAVIWTSKFQRCQNCLSSLEQIKLNKDGKIEIINK